jgi:riboflavin kinase/FMN adenylyltransferase
MQHVSALEDLRLDRPACLTLGSFDGVHLGHQALIGAMTEHAHNTGRAAVVITFYPHPSVVLRGRRPSFYLSTPDEKAEYLSALGVDAGVTHPFNHEVATITAPDFVTRLITHAQLSELWCGNDFALGHNREGTVDFLRAQGEQRGFRVTLAQPILADGEAISSTRIRQALRDGAVEQAARYLGRPFRLTGMVVEGAKRGRTIGIPTANLSVSDERAIPATGVYACRVRDLAGADLAVTNIGFRPTFNNPEPSLTIEAHLLDFSGDLYARPLTLDFIARLRPEMKFSGIDALVAQIQRDIGEARNLMSEK